MNFQHTCIEQSQKLKRLLGRPAVATAVANTYVLRAGNTDTVKAERRRSLVRGDFHLHAGLQGFDGGKNTKEKLVVTVVCMHTNPFSGFWNLFLDFQFRILDLGFGSFYDRINLQERV